MSDKKLSIEICEKAVETRRELRELNEKANNFFNQVMKAKLNQRQGSPCDMLCTSFYAGEGTLGVAKVVGSTLFTISEYHEALFNIYEGKRKKLIKILEALNVTVTYEMAYGPKAKKNPSSTER